MFNKKKKKRSALKTLIALGGVAAAGVAAKKIYDSYKEAKDLDLTEADMNVQNWNEINRKFVVPEEPTNNNQNDEPASEDETQSEDEDANQLTIEAVDKIGKLEDLLTYEELEFDVNQSEYVHHIIDYIKENLDIRTAVLIGMQFNGKTPFEVFTDNQFAAIKRILK